MGTRESWFVWYCWQCTILVATGTCCYSTCSNPTMKESSERPGRVDRCLIFSWYFGHTESPLGPRITLSWGYLYQEHKGPLGQPHDAFPTCSLLGSLQLPVQTTPGSLLLFQKSRWIQCLYALIASVYTVHLCLLMLYTLRLLWLWCARPPNPHSPVHPVTPFLLLAEDRNLLLVFIRVFTLVMPDQRWSHQDQGM